jgi:mannose-6-phosphate isomerase-like protein (cupin superfamily)
MVDKLQIYRALRYKNQFKGSKYMKKFLIVFLMLFSTFTVFGQEKGALDEYNLDVKPFDPAIDPDGSLFMKNWQESAPHTVFGALNEWDILTPCDGDSEHPKTRGAVLTVIKGLTYGILDPFKTTTPSVLKDEQKIFYFVSGQGTLLGGARTADVREGIGVVVASGIEFTIKNTGGEPLAMYIITEPIPAGFKPNKEIVVKDEKGTKWSSNNVHWSHNYKNFINKEDGLAVLIGMGPVWYLPETIGQPHTHSDPIEEIWFALNGDTDLLLGKQFFHLSPGTAYKIPPTGFTGHSNMNSSDKPIKMFWMMNSGKITKTGFKYGQLDGSPYDPRTESRIDMFISGYKEHMQYSTHGTLLERDMFTRNNGDASRPTDRGSVLKFLDRFTYAMLVEGDRTVPTTLTTTQELYYILEGMGAVSGGGKTYNLYPGVAFMVPKGLEFFMENTGNTPLSMFLVAEKVDESFKPAKEIVWRDENMTQYHTTTAHWVNHNKWLTLKNQGMAKIDLFLSVTIPPNSFAQPHSHDPGTEEIWAPIDGPVSFMLGKQLRKMDVGEAYLVPPDGKTPHANFNSGSKPVKMLYIGMFNQK